MSTAFSNKSFWTINTDNTTLVYAKAGVDPSYKYYNNISWSMWGMWAPSNNSDMFSMWEESTNSRSWLFSTQTDGTFRIIGSWDGSSFCLLKSATPVLDFGWHHFVVTFTNGVFQLYVDGVLQSFTTILPWGGGSVPLFAANEPLLIANKNPVSPQNDDSAGGGYSNFSMWNKVLSGAEVLALYRNGQPGDLTGAANLTNWYRMDQTDTPPTLTDSKAAGASATIHTSGATPFFQQNNNVPTYSTDPGVANVLVGVVYNILGNALTGTYVTPVSTDPGVANVANGVAYEINNVSKVGTLDAVTNVLKAATLVGQSLNATLTETNP